MSKPLPEQKTRVSETSHSTSNKDLSRLSTASLRRVTSVFANSAAHYVNRKCADLCNGVTVQISAAAAAACAPVRHPQHKDTTNSQLDVINRRSKGCTSPPTQQTKQLTGYCAPWRGFVSRQPRCE